MPQSSPAPTFPPPGYTCTPPYDASSAPLVEDCKLALQQVTPGQPEICTQQIQTGMDFVTVGTCTVHTYSAHGKAHCLNGDDIRGAIWSIIHLCSSDGFTRGSFTWTPEGASADGVTLKRSSSVPV